MRLDQKQLMNSLIQEIGDYLEENCEGIEISYIERGGVGIAVTVNGHKIGDIYYNTDTSIKVGYPTQLAKSDLQWCSLPEDLVDKVKPYGYKIISLSIQDPDVFKRCEHFIGKMKKIAKMWDFPQK